MITRMSAHADISTLVHMDITSTIADSTPGTTAYSDAIASYNLYPDLSPARAVTARSTADIQAAIARAREEGLRVSVLATGHSAHTAQPMTDALLIRTALDEPVRIDPAARTATIPAGTRWQSVVDAAADHGLAVLHGSSGSVGAIGFLLRGGISFYGRAYGVAANTVLSITLVRADGSVVTVSAGEQPELFWALRGGGGGFGVVTSVTVRLLPMWRVLAGITVWDIAHADAVARAWRGWAGTAPSALTTSLRILNLPALPGVPPAIAGRPVLAIDGAASVESAEVLDERTAAVAALLEPLRGIAHPLVDDWQLRPTADLPLTHMDPPDPLPYVGDHMLLSRLTDDDISALVRLAASGSALTAVELRQLGGAFARPVVRGGVFDRTDAAFALLEIGAVGGGVTAAQQRDTMAQVRAALAHRDTGFTLPTFVESTTQPSRSFARDLETIVDGVRQSVDPDGLFAPAVVPFVDPS